MQQVRAFLISAALGGGACMACADTEPEPPTKVLIAPDQAVAGASQAVWSQRWWQWAFSFDDDESPVADRTGALCAARQSGDVWFLAGTYGSHRTERTCRVPAGKYLFFPLINYVQSMREGVPLDCGLLKNNLAAVVSDPSALILEVDGVRFDKLKAHRLRTPKCFSIESGTPPDSAADGYYVMLAPLAPGEHLINFGGVLPRMAQAVTYRLIVK